MKVTPTRIPDILVIEPQVFGDDRGFFFESFNQKAFNEAVGQEITFVQDNHSKSAKNVLRGLHYQLPPKAQGKLVRVVQGEVFDVAVDLRKNSKTYGQCVVSSVLKHTMPVSRCELNRQSAFHLLASLFIHKMGYYQCQTI